jgi:hypothetical protein
MGTGALMEALRAVWLAELMRQILCMTNDRFRSFPPAPVRPILINSLVGRLAFLKSAHG